MNSVDPSFIKPFIVGTIETLKIQCSVEPKVGKPYRKTDNEVNNIDIAAVVGLTSKNFNGSIAICFPEQTFLNLMEGMLGEKFGEIDKDLEDGAGELLNIIFGYAKKILNDGGSTIEKAIPSIVSGKNIKLGHMSDGAVGMVPFSSDAGDFIIEIAIGN